MSGLRFIFWVRNFCHCLNNPTSGADAEADEESELTIEVSASQKVGAIRGILLELEHTGFNESTPLKFLKQCRELGLEVRRIILKIRF